MPEEKSEIFLKQKLIKSVKASEELIKQYLEISFHNLMKKKLEAEDNDIQNIMDFYIFLVELYISISRFITDVSEKLMADDETTKFVTKISSSCLQRAIEEIKEISEKKLKEFY